MAVSNWSKLSLLMWKNWLLQWRHKIQMIMEILIPAVFCALLVLIRGLVDPELVPNATVYNPLTIGVVPPIRDIFGLIVGPDINRLIYSPKSDVMDVFMGKVTLALNLTQGYVGVNSSEELQREMFRNNYFAGVQFNDIVGNEIPSKLSYSIRFPGELRTGRLSPLTYNWFTNLQFPRFTRPGPRVNLSDSGGIPPGYYQEGFLSIQNSIASEYLNLKSPQGIMPEILLHRYPYPPYINDVLLTGLESLVSLIIMLSFVYPCINTVKFIAAEKEKQLKEAMKIMGLANWLHWTSWFVRSMVLMMISISIMVILLKITWFSGSTSSVFTHSDWSALWFFLFIYSISTATYCFMLSVFFSRANTAAAFSGLFWFIFYSAYTFTRESYDQMSMSEKLAMCLLSNTGMAFGFQIIIRYEGLGEGFQWSNYFKPVTIDDNLTVGHITIMLLVTSVVYMLITLYVEKIFPGEYGVPQRWYFPFTRTFWCGSRFGTSHIGVDTDDPNSSHSIQNLENFESEPHGLNAGIKIRGLRKVYSNRKVAVKSLTLNMYDDQITVLLGHNGAGKTTTMSILTGMFPPTSGSAFVNGRDIRTDITAVRDSLGLCPQHNVLFDELTVGEHIEFFSRLKGCDSKQVQQEVDKYLRLIDLQDKVNAQSRTLSGGMKRKLSVCVAFCGGSKVVLCDEPTSGMDPSARRALWDVLEKEKKGRTVLLSTHFMDEADILGDRIAIMANGELKCSGSSYFLKKKFGAGYHLICVKGPHTNSNRITNLLQKYVPNAHIENDIGTELSYQLPDAEASSFEEMFTELENNMVEFGIESYGVSLTTLEEVFMKVGTDSNEADATEDDNDDNHSHKNGFNLEESLSYTEQLQLITGVRLMATQVYALFKKKLLQTYRGWLMLLIQICIPAAFIILTVLAERAQAAFRDLPALHISLASYRKSVTILQTDPDMKTGSFESKFSIEYQKQIHSAHDASIQLITSDMQTYLLQLAQTILVLINEEYMVGASILEPNRITAWFNNQAYHTAPLAVGLVHNSVIKAHLGSEYGIEVTNAPMPYTADTRYEMMKMGSSLGFQLAINISFAMSFVAAFYVIPYIRERESRSKLLQLVSGAKVITFWITAMIWDYITYLLTVFVLVLVFSQFHEDGWSTFTEIMRILVILFAFGFAVLPVTYIFSMFFSVPASGFTRMTMLYVFTGMAMFFVVFIMSLDIYDLVDVANTLKWIFLIFPHFALSHSLNNINLIVQEQQLCKIRCDMQAGCTHEIMCTFFPSCCNEEYFAWKEPGIGRDLFYMIAVGIVAFIWLQLVEYRLIAAVIYAIKNCLPSRGFAVTTEDREIDSDVRDEQHRVEAMSQMEIRSLSLVAKSITKAYGNFVAVNQLSVGVDSQECFGLLGINGAGKTSTFKMLTGDEKITSGEAWVHGISLKSNMNGVHQIIGYCPQFDALADEMTGRETLELFCRLRGVPSSKIKMTTKSLAIDLNFKQHLDKKVKEYSGGNKRKLSTAIALIGNPIVVYLDEPTTGMDPGAKRKLWNMICKIRQSGKSIVLTSHSMDECEALCTRLAIMVNGNFQCLGSVQHLKNKYSKGYTLTIKMKKKSFGFESATPIISSPQHESAILEYDGLSTISTNDSEQSIEALKDYITQNFPGASLQEDSQGMLTYKIPTSEHLKWSKMFGQMQIAKMRFNIEDYSLSQTSLEQVFLSFAKHQREDSQLLNSPRRN